MLAVSGNPQNEFFSTDERTIRLLIEGDGIRNLFYENIRLGAITRTKLEGFGVALKNLRYPKNQKCPEKVIFYIQTLTAEICDALSDRKAQNIFLYSLDRLTPFVSFSRWAEGIRLFLTPPKDYFPFANRERYVVMQEGIQNKISNESLEIVNSYLGDFKRPYCFGIEFFEKMVELMNFSILCQEGTAFGREEELLNQFSSDLRNRIKRISASMPLNPFASHADAPLLKVLKRLKVLTDTIYWRSTNYGKIDIDDL